MKRTLSQEPHLNKKVKHSPATILLDQTIGSIELRNKFSKKRDSFKRYKKDTEKTRPHIPLEFWFDKEYILSCLPSAIKWDKESIHDPPSKNDYQDHGKRYYTVIQRDNIRLMLDWLVKDCDLDRGLVERLVRMGASCYFSNRILNSLTVDDFVIMLKNDPNSKYLVPRRMLSDTRVQELLPKKQRNCKESYKLSEAEKNSIKQAEYECEQRKRGLSTSPRTTKLIDEELRSIIEKRANLPFLSLSKPPFIYDLLIEESKKDRELIKKILKINIKEYNNLNDELKNDMEIISIITDSTCYPELYGHFKISISKENMMKYWGKGKIPTIYTYKYGMDMDFFDWMCKTHVRDVSFFPENGPKGHYMIKHLLDIGVNPCRILPRIQKSEIVENLPIDPQERNEALFSCLFYEPTLLEMIDRKILQSKSKVLECLLRLSSGSQFDKHGIFISLYMKGLLEEMDPQVWKDLDFLCRYLEYIPSAIALFSYHVSPIDDLIMIAPQKTWHYLPDKIIIRMLNKLGLSEKGFIMTEFYASNRTESFDHSNVPCAPLFMPYERFLDHPHSVQVVKNALRFQSCGKYVRLLASELIAHAILDNAMCGALSPRPVEMMYDIGLIHSQLNDNIENVQDATSSNESESILISAIDYKDVSRKFEECYPDHHINN